MKRKVFKILIYCLFLFTFLELSSIAFLFSRLGKKIIKNARCDAGKRLTWIKRHKIFSNEIYYKFDIFHPALGRSLKPNLRNEQIFKKKILNSNSKGIRGAKEHRMAAQAIKDYLVTEKIIKSHL